MKEAFRVLKPGGRFAVSDVVVRGDIPPEIRKSMELWVGCLAGALGDHEYVAKLAFVRATKPVAKAWASALPVHAGKLIARV
jgi:ubiquinone/menaquinone biosynthesis C-methylase UbiE